MFKKQFGLTIELTDLLMNSMWGFGKEKQKTVL